jgi:ubiquitin carboxyl-terminal hydrolase 7
MVFELPVSRDDDDMCFNLQKLFAPMQTECGKAVSTEYLTKSFGWDNDETSRQQDIQEFGRVLLGCLEGRIADRPQSCRIAELFQGTTRVILSCPEEHWTNERVEIFYDLSLMVKGCSALEGSFEMYVRPEELAGDNQYHIPGIGPRNVKMVTNFVKFPKILHIHFRRFEFDVESGGMVKINSILIFPSEMDIRAFLSEKHQHLGSTGYELIGLLVHRGPGALSGHYYAFLRMSPSDWYEFNDSSVRRVSSRDAIEKNFDMEGDFSAYTLVYVQKSEVPDLFRPVGNNLIPKNVLNDIVIRPADNVTNVHLTLTT